MKKSRVWQYQMEKRNCMTETGESLLSVIDLFLVIDRGICPIVCHQALSQTPK